MIVIFVTVFMVLVIGQVSLPGILMGADSHYKSFDDYKYDHLKKMASRQGMVRVIATLAVPDIDVLTASSTAFKTGNPEESYIQAALNADLALEDGISQTRDAVLYRLNRSSYVINRTYTTLPCVALSVSAEGLDILRTLPEVLDIEEDKPTPLSTTELENDNDDLSRPQLYRSVEIVGADVAWGFGYTGAGWYVAILDSGILRTHEMFQGKNIVEQCYSLGYNWYDRENGGCPNGRIEMSGPGSAAPYQSRFGHGTHVAGIAAGNNQNDRFGVAKNANIIAIQVFSYFPSENDVLSWGSDQIKGLEYVYTMRNTYNIASANMSLGAERYYNYCETDMRAAAINNLKAVGIATAVASGNDGYCDSVSTPACVSAAVTVSGSTKQNQEYIWGNWHNFIVDLLAPAEGITSAFSTGNTDYTALSGTSMAAPHVAGAWAIMKQFDPTMSVDDIQTLLQNTGLMITSASCPGTQPRPRFNVGNAIMTLLTLAPPANLSAEQVTNKSFLRSEYINVITWEENPLNAEKNVALYKIYVVQGSQLSFVAQVDSSTFSYMHRNQGYRQDIIYAVTAVNTDGQESLPIQYQLGF